MKNKQELELYRKNLLEKQKQTSNQNIWMYLLFSKGLPLISPIVLGLFAKRVNPKNKLLKFILQKSILLGIPFLIKTIFKKK